jgi:hypothetical protein
MGRVSPQDTAHPIGVEEHAAIRFLEQNGYDVSYSTHSDVDRYYNDRGDSTGAGSLRLPQEGVFGGHNVYIVGGHDEYWSGEHMKALEAARANGMSLFFMSGNEGFWKTRWEDDYRTLVCYKETQENGLVLDPSEVFTGLWRDLRSQKMPSGASFNSEYDLMQPENSLTGRRVYLNIWKETSCMAK